MTPSPIIAAALAAAVCAAATVARADLVSITNGGAILNPPPADAGRANSAQADVVQGFNETRGVRLPAELRVFSYLTNAEVVIPAGTIVASHMVFFDPAGADAQTASAVITISRPILGFITTDTALFQTHALLGRFGVSYPSSHVNRYGFESPEQITGVTATSFGFSSSASRPGDRFRVLTLGRCSADADASGSVDARDIFAFLSLWFANATAADFDTADGVQVIDIFAFLSAWFAGC